MIWSRTAQKFLGAQTVRGGLVDQQSGSRTGKNIKTQIKIRQEKLLFQEVSSVHCEVQVPQ